MPKNTGSSQSSAGPSSSRMADESWLEELRTEMDHIILNARLLGHPGIKGAGYAKQALFHAEHGDYEKAKEFRNYAIERWAEFVATGT